MKISSKSSALVNEMIFYLFLTRKILDVSQYDVHQERFGIFVEEA